MLRFTQSHLHEYSTLLILYWVTESRDLILYPRRLKARGGGNPVQVINLIEYNHTLTHTHSHTTDASQSTLHVFGPDTHYSAP